MLWCNLALSDGFERNILAEVLITRLERVGYDVDVLLQASPTDVLQAGASLGMDARRQRFAS